MAVSCTWWLLFSSAACIVARSGWNWQSDILAGASFGSVRTCDKWEQRELTSEQGREEMVYRRQVSHLASVAVVGSCSLTALNVRNNQAIQKNNKATPPVPHYFFQFQNSTWFPWLLPVNYTASVMPWHRVITDNEKIAG